MNDHVSGARHVPLAALTFSTTPAQKERREHLDERKLAELAESIKAHGLVQPVLVRPVKGARAEGLNGVFFAHLGKNVFSPDEVEEIERSTFEVVAGERRVIAARQAGLEEIAATVRELTDEQVTELQLIENLQREDLHELAEAEGYEQLLQRGHGAEEIADKVGKSKATVYARMKLLELIPEARKAYYAGQLSASTALYVARIPAALQKSALADITKPQGYGDEKAPMSARQAQKHIHDHYMLRLADAGFKTGDATLVPSAGACGVCPKRTGNQPELFGDVRNADVCTDPVCFRQKIAAHAERAIAAAAETGQRVLVGAEAKKVAKYGTDAHRLEGYVRLDARDYTVNGKPRTFRQVLGKSYVPTLLQDPDSGKLIEIAPDRDVDKAHGDGGRGSSGRAAQQYKEKQPAQDRKHRQEVAYRAALFAAIHSAGVSRNKALARAELERVAERLFGRLDHDSQKRLFAVLGWAVTKRQYSTDFIFPTPIPKMTDSELAQIIRDCTLAHELQVWRNSGEYKPKDMEAAAAELGVDFNKIRRDLQAATKAKAEKKATAKATKKRKSK